MAFYGLMCTHRGRRGTTATIPGVSKVLGTQKVSGVRLFLELYKVIFTCGFSVGFSKLRLNEPEHLADLHGWKPSSSFVKTEE